MSPSDLVPDGGSHLLIGGKLTPGGGGVFTTADPATGETLGNAANADPADMDAAIAAARTAFDTTDWSRDPGFRATRLRQIRSALQSNNEDLREIP
ncbi:aldehyde dehydrogenase family protein, partial [Nocardia seriolae]|uniref:aldehyde dehydrogenase family protein n=1 Tax=Nocardia seriolae TaxID=37332 RepID=UPI0012BD158B